MGRLITKTLAEIYLKQGHLKEAYEIYKALAENDPSDPEIQTRLKELKEELGVTPSTRKSGLLKEEKIRILEKWLANVQERKGK
jgi:predicted Zn-dependent protease